MYFLNVKALAVFNQDKAIVGAFSVIVKLQTREGLFPALVLYTRPHTRPECWVFAGSFSLNSSEWISRLSTEQQPSGHLADTTDCAVC